MARRETPRPTDRELSLLRVLWQRGPSTVREVHQELQATEPLAYTTVLTTLQIMTDKGLVTRDTSQRSHVYRAALSREETQENLVLDLLGRAFNGSAMNLVLRALSAKPASAEEIEQLRDYLARWHANDPEARKDDPDGGDA